jgi:hypothetical protein
VTDAAAEERRWLALSYGYGIVAALVLGYLLVRIPIQVSDCFSELVNLAVPFKRAFIAALTEPGYLRVGRYVEFKLVYELAQGHYNTAFRLVHAAHLVVLAWLFVRLLQPRTAAAAVAVPLGFAVLFGAHTFMWTVREAFPLNHFLTILVACAAAANLSFAAPRRAVDGAAVLLLAMSLLTLESGALVWVILVTGYVLGLRGVSKQALAAASAIAIGYVVVRFVVLGNGLPMLGQREAGFGFTRLDGAALQATFGRSPLPFYAYNVAVSLVGSLVAEPRDGTFDLIDSIRRGQISLPLALAALVSTLSTACVVAFMWSRRAAWRAWRLEREDCVAAMFWVVWLANGVICFAYTKDVVLSPAGFFYAAAVTIAATWLVRRASVGPTVGMACLLLVLSAGWTIRSVGLHAALADTALDVREQWAYVDDWIAQHHFPMPPDVQALKQRLQDEALFDYATPSGLRDEWTRWFEMK